MNGCMDTLDLRHFEPKTFRHYVFGAKVSQIFVFVSWTVRHNSAGDTLDPELKDASSVAIVLRNVDPLYIRYSNGMKVLGK